MKFRLLGRLEVESDDGGVLTIRSTGRRLLLGLLGVCYDRAVPVERILEIGPTALGGGLVKSPPSSVGAAHVQVARLRAQLREPVIRTVPSGYVLDSAGHDLDVRQFVELLRPGTHRSSEEPDEDRLQRLTRALDLWRGPPITGVAPPDWPELVALTDLRLDAVTAWAELAVAAGQAGGVATRLCAVLAEAPLRELLWARYLSALHHDGRDAEAVSAYRRCRDLLMAELQVVPGPEIEAAYSLVTGRSIGSPQLREVIQVGTGPAEATLRSALLDAADYAARVGGHEQAIESYRALLSCGSLRQAGRSAVLLRLGESLYNAHQDPTEVLVEARAGFATRGDRTGTGHAGFLLAKTAWLRGDGRATRLQLAEVVETLTSARASTQRNMVLSSAAGLLTVSGDAKSGIDLAEIAYRTQQGRVPAGQSPEEWSRATEVTLLNLGVNRMMGGDLSGVHQIRRAVESHQQTHGWVPPRYLVNLADAAVNTGDLPGAARYLKDAARSAQEHGASADRRWIMAEQAAVALQLGRHQLAARLAAAVLTASRSQPHYLDSVVLSVSAALALHARQLPRALDQAETGLTLARTTGDPQLLTPAMAVTARARIEAGDTVGGSFLVDELLGSLTGRLLVPQVAIHLPAALVALGRATTEIRDAEPAASPWLDTADPVSTRSH